VFVRGKRKDGLIALSHTLQVFEELLDETDVGQPVLTDSVYDSAETRKMLRRKKIGCRIHKKGARYVTFERKSKEKQTEANPGQGFV
jgi:IS5 family transposase